MTRYHATPAFRCLAPAKVFIRRDRAEAWAERMAEIHRTPYAVWQIEGGLLRLLRRIPAPSPAA